MTQRKMQKQAFLNAMQRYFDEADGVTEVYLRGFADVLFEEYEKLTDPEF